MREKKITKKYVKSRKEKIEEKKLREHITLRHDIELNSSQLGVSWLHLKSDWIISSSMACWYVICCKLIVYKTKCLIKTCFRYRRIPSYTSSMSSVLRRFKWDTFIELYLSFQIGRLSEFTFDSLFSSQLLFSIPFKCNKSSFHLYRWIELCHYPVDMNESN